MSRFLFDKEISPKCEYCETGVATADGKEILCRRKGVMSPDSFCKKFRYDPLKRKPTVVQISSGFTQDDFKL